MTITLRPYQDRAIRRAVQSLNDADRARALVALPTGSGKTMVGLVAAARFVTDGGVVKWLAYQRELLERAEAELEIARRDGLVGEHVQFDFETVQKQSNLTLRRGTSLVVVDEAHHLHRTAEYWRDLRRKTVPILGLTGTPRSTHEADGWHLAEYIARSDLTPRYLAQMIPHRQRTGFTPRHVGLQTHFYGRDFDAETYRALDDPRRNRGIAQLLKRSERRLGQMLVFVHTTDHCESLADACGTAGLRAAYVHGKVKSTVREGVFRDFANGAINVLVNAKLVSEGIDVPALDTIVMAVPTISDIRFAQMLGRGCRRTDTKTSFNLLDLVDNLGEFERLLEGRYLFDGARNPGATFDASNVSERDYYNFPTSDQIDQPYLAELAKRLTRGFLTGPLAEAISADHVETVLLRFAQQANIALSEDLTRPLEVQIVHEHILPLVAKHPGGAGARKEMACEDGTRCDLFVPGDPATVMEFSTRRVNEEKARQLLGYVERFRRCGEATRFRPILVAVSYKGEARSRQVTVDGVALEFKNWHDFIRELVANVQGPLARAQDEQGAWTRDASEETQQRQTSARVTRTPGLGRVEWRYQAGRSGNMMRADSLSDARARAKAASERNPAKVCTVWTSQEHDSHWHPHERWKDGVPVE